MFDSGLIWYGEIRCQSLLGLKGLILQALSILLEENTNILFVLCGHDCQLSTMYCFPAKSMLVKFYFFFFFTPQQDHDECISGNIACDVNAYCTNTVGSYYCTCKEGYTGDGRSCSGTLLF